ncbi:MAG: hypothetical protein ACTSRG_10635 [Candidatus Helarchaeota archaeon]
MVDETTKGFMKELVEFISLIRASEKERYEVQKQFMDDTINTIKDISDSIKASGEYLRTNIEKLKETLTSGINTIRKEINVDTMIEAKNVLAETIDVLQKETQLHAFRQTMQDIRNSIEKIQEKKLSQSLKDLITASNPNLAPKAVSPETQAKSPPEIKPEPPTKEEKPIQSNEQKEKKPKKSKEPKSDTEKYHIEF